MEVGVYGNMLPISTPHILRKILKFLIEFFRPYQWDDADSDHQRPQAYQFYAILFGVCLILIILIFSKYFILQINSLDIHELNNGRTSLATRVHSSK